MVAEYLTERYEDLSSVLCIILVSMTPIAFPLGLLTSPIGNI